MLFRENVALAPLTTLGVGGAARYFAEARNEAEVIEAVQLARSRNLHIFVLGGGSNVVVADSGFPGLVLKIAIEGVSRHDIATSRSGFTAGAGCGWDDFVAGTVEAGCAGLECLSGIPGTVGATPVQNVGAYGQEVSQTITELRVLDLQSMQVTTLANSGCGFGYRSSIFNTTARRRYIILQVSFALERDGQPALRYPDVRNYFAGQPGKPTLQQVRQAVRVIRHRKAMLIVPGDPDARSVGSFFKNPVVPQSFADELAARAAQRGWQLPTYPAADGLRKIPAAWLLEHSGFTRGETRGRAGISTKHALAIVNRGGATAAEILALRDEIEARVHAEFGVELQPEPVFLGL